MLSRPFYRRAKDFLLILIQYLPNSTKTSTTTKRAMLSGPIYQRPKDFLLFLIQYLSNSTKTSTNTKRAMLSGPIYRRAKDFLLILIQYLSQTRPKHQQMPRRQCCLGQSTEGPRSALSTKLRRPSLRWKAIK